jgi:hypothetical protein
MRNMVEGVNVQGRFALTASAAVRERGQSTIRCQGVVIARSEATKQSREHREPHVPLDCFASLAMTDLAPSNRITPYSARRPAIQAIASSSEKTVSASGAGGRRAMTTSIPSARAASILA